MHVLWNNGFLKLILTEACDELKGSLEKGFSNALSADLVTGMAPCLGAGFGGSRRKRISSSQ